MVSFFAEVKRVMLKSARCIVVAVPFAAVALSQKDGFGQSSLLVTNVVPAALPTLLTRGLVDSAHVFHAVPEPSALCIVGSLALFITYQFRKRASRD